MIRRRSASRSISILAGVMTLLLTTGCKQSAPPATKTPSAATSQAANESTDNQAAATQPTATLNSKVVAYYFHRELRCSTCLSIEEQARTAIESNYRSELDSGQLKWHALNIEEPDNEHYEIDFELESSSLILVEMTGEEVVRWKNLTDVWDLVDDPAGFQLYIWTEIDVFLGV